MLEEIPFPGNPCWKRNRHTNPIKENYDKRILKLLGVAYSL
jgi:hypothetical protein